MTVEVSQDDTVLFVGGSTELDFEKGVAILQAVTFGKALGYISDLRIDERDNKYISKIRRIEDTDKFLAATLDVIYVYEFKNRKFYKLSAILNIGSKSDSIMDLVFIKNTVYAFCAGDTEINKIEFAAY